MSFLFILASCLVLAQSTSDTSSDERDQGILRDTLYVSVSVEDIHRSEDVQALVERQAEEMVAATQRLMLRQEKRIADMTAAIRQLEAKHEDLQPLLDEMNKRVETARVAIERASALRVVLDAASAERRRGAFRRGAAVMKFTGNGAFRPVDMKLISTAYRKKFGRPLPVSAVGDTDLHRALGFDHSGRIDVALSPDQPEGVWLRRYLEAIGVPYYGFRRAVPGAATAPHIHIGPGSVRVLRKAG